MDELRFALRGCVALAELLAVATLVTCWLPGLRQSLPAWLTMHAETALLVLVSGASLQVLSLGPADTQAAAWPAPEGQPWVRRSGKALALLVGLMSVAVLLEAALPNWFASGALRALPPERMSWQTAGLFVLLAVVMLLIDTRRRAAAVLADACLSLLVLAEMVLVSGYLFGATHLFGLAHSTATRPETVLALMLLTFAALGRRAEGGVFVILLGRGIGSKVARLAFPAILVLFFLLEVARDRAHRAGWMSSQYGAAIETSVAAILALALVLALAWRIEGLEREVRELSLRDPLTGLYNRRGFYLFAEQLMAGVQRSRAPLSVLYIDLDNLKQINDSLGHDVGSQCLVEAATLLKESFRKTDVVGRIGGDEFVVAGESSAMAMHSAVRRLEEAAAERNALPDRLYPFSFSLGFASTTEARPETLEELLTRADRNMYEAKRRKKLSRG